jgi:glycerol uptake facilitator-like aquaporin
VAEFISTLVFVFAGVGSAIAYSEPVITINC